MTGLTAEELERRAYADGEVEKAKLLRALRTDSSYDMGYRDGHLVGYTKALKELKKNARKTKT